MAKQMQKRLVEKSALRVLDISLLGVDIAYQRDLKPGHKAIAGKFNEEALGVPLVGEREDRSLWIVDGQQRIGALKLLGRTKVRAEVFNSKGVEHEAAVFKLVNMHRIKLSPHEQFRALLAGHDKLAWEVKEAVESEGFTIGGAKRGGGSRHDRNWLNVMCITTVMNVAKIHGVEPVKFALRMAKQAWPSDLLAVYNLLVGGLCGLWAAHTGAVDEERLLLRLQATTPQKILYAAGQGLAQSKITNCTEVLERLYRKRLTRRPGH